MIYSNPLIKIELEESEIPWLKIFTQRSLKEFSMCTHAEKEMIFTTLDIIEKEMITYFEPEKINIASFGNYVPHLHWHIMARFKEDSYFPEPMWGTLQRDGFAEIKEMTLFLQLLTKKLQLGLKY